MRPAVVGPGIENGQVSKGMKARRRATQSLGEVRECGEVTTAPRGWLMGSSEVRGRPTHVREAAR